MAIKGVAFACFAKGTYTDGTAPVYSNGKQFAKLVSANVSFTRSNAKLYADNVLDLVDAGITGGSISIDTSYLDDDDQVDVLGMTKGEDGVVYETDDDPPIGGFGYVITEEDDAGVDHYIGYIVYKAQFALNEQNANTRGESTEFQTHSLEGTFMGARVDNSGKIKFRAHKDCTTETAALAWVKEQLNIT